MKFGCDWRKIGHKGDAGKTPRGHLVHRGYEKWIFIKDWDRMPGKFPKGKSHYLWDRQLFYAVFPKNARQVGYGLKKGAGR